MIHLSDILVLVASITTVVRSASLLSSVETFPDSETLNRNWDDLEKIRQQTSHNVRVVNVDDNNSNNQYVVGQFPESSSRPVLIELPQPQPLKSRQQKYFGASGMPKYCQDEFQCEMVDSRLRTPSNHHRYRRSSEACHHEVSIAAFGSNYTLCIFETHIKSEPIVRSSYGVLNVTLFSLENTSLDLSIDTLDLHFASGYVLEEDFASVSGFILDQHFYGTVYMKDTVHFLEPHDRKSRDMHIFGDGLKTLLHNKPLSTEKTTGNKKKSKGITVSKKAQKRKICDLTIVADHLFYKEVGELSVEKTVLQMLWHIKEANALFQSKDFDDDGTSECLGFTVSEITIFKEAESTVNLLTGNFSVPEDFLKRFSRYNFDGFCLGVLFTNRAFSELVLGLAWRGNPKSDGVGGICQNRVRIKSDRNAYSFNALFISLKSSQEDRIPLRMGVLNLVHEMMHGFGAKHDPEAAVKPECTPSDKFVNGRYLMSKYSNDGHKLNHQILSPCTKALVKSNLQAPHRVSCLKKFEEPFCGDGIVQEGEECDCGTIFQCLAARSCCIPPSGSYKKPCTLQTDLDACIP